MIYTAKKNGQIRQFSDVDRPILDYYRRRGWRITAKLGKLKERSHQVLQIRKKSVKKGGKNGIKAVS